MRMSRRRFFAGLSGFTASALLGSVLPEQSMARLAGSPPTKLPRRGRTRPYSIVACGSGGCNLLAANVGRLRGRAELFAVDQEGLDTRFESHVNVKTYTIASAEEDVLVSFSTKLWFAALRSFIFCVTPKWFCKLFKTLINKLSGLFNKIFIECKRFERDSKLWFIS